MNKIVVGVSGGPDSMMLLDSLIKENKQIIVAHVNYQKRDSAFKDEKIVEDYCKKHNLVLERYYPKERTGNFQNWAREVRYLFFANLVEKHQCEGVAVGHQLNDLIETYLLQKKRQSVVSYYGLREETIIEKVTVWRPLLKYSREDVLAYCRDNELDYNLDETNENSRYQRTLIRKEISNYDITKLKAYKDKIKEDNKLIKMKEQELLDKSFVELDEDKQKALLYTKLKKQGYYRFSEEHLLEICRQLKEKGYYFYLDEIIVELINHNLKVTLIKNTKYEYLIKTAQEKDFGHFKIEKNGEINFGVALNKDDWPLTIRNWSKGDKIELNYGTKRISRWFIDNKILRSERISWPIVLNRYGKIILVPGIGSDKSYLINKPDIYVIK